MTIINAGHPPVVCLPVNGEPFLIKTEGDILGMFKDAHFGSQTLTVSPRDRFFIYSDGLVESAENKITWVNGADSLLPVYREIAGLPYEKAPKALIDRLFGEEGLPEDDIVVLCVEV